MHRRCICNLELARLRRRYGYGRPPRRSRSTLGGDLLLPAIAAAVMGGADLNGGEGSMPGAGVGALLIATLQQFVLWQTTLTDCLLRRSLTERNLADRVDNIENGHRSTRLQRATLRKFRR